MKKIASFTVNHLTLIPGLYVSRIDKVNDSFVTTFDIRITKPNTEPVMDNPGIHAIEHLGATFLRNHDKWKEQVIYFGPMGCRTGFYMILAGNYNSLDVYDLVKEMFEFIINYEGVIPGASAIECGNYLDLNLSMAKFYAKKYKKEVLENFIEEKYIYK
ncbi:MAG: S-ribosylhomocysteine lyase [Erysipelotrichaceae bacterium]|nr:S-ribosylhomocysteine lyase [Erysipelotrichaceae bacterium]